MKFQIILKLNKLKLYYFILKNLFLIFFKKMEIENKYVTDPTEIINFLNNLGKKQTYEKIIFEQELEIKKLKLKLT